ncbi:L-2-hydroxyglutarate oxidase [Egibacter rhizosphaerae]|uniref:L-2-hydroxyglutarate oxidase n=1 Tax=Egibacter rhizosphaerae TaxID=1670831 RepID=A0A411YBZ7_9ACTN|nr:L-2-hydroxyglutarate oxidase [Egibacter rhizosphaerae]QBI18716.1 L-2-hydroxyglutarate oxidase [Egibacter rhizosphaerae]
MRIGIVGGGIIGLAVARELLRRHPDSELTVFEKERTLGHHQTGRNSGVVHAGLYYTPGSLKARLCRRGVGLLHAYCRERGIRYEACGKVVVARDEAELTRLRGIHERATANGVPDVELVGADELERIEPHASGIAALHSPHTAIVDFGAVARSLSGDVQDLGGAVRTGSEVTAIETRGGGAADIVLRHGQERRRVDQLVLAGGLHSDRLAEQIGDSPEPRIVPFRGEYHRLVPAREHLVRGLIYPVPDPGTPFLGVHLTRTVGRGVLVGPNAVLALGREGYRRTDLVGRDVRETLAWPGLWRLARRHWRVGAREVLTSASRQAFATQARQYVPALRARDLMPGPAGVRAQAVARDGSLVDDFWLSSRDGVLCVRNAPSPAATSALAIAEEILDRTALS